MVSLRIRLIQILFTLVFFLVSLRLFYWQVVRSSELTGRAVSQHDAVVSLPARRGAIYSSDGFMLAGTEEDYLLYAYKPQLTTPLPEIVDKLSPLIVPDLGPATSEAEIKPDPEELLKNTRAQLEEKLHSDRSWVALKYHLNRSQKEAIEALGIAGLGFDTQVVRFYPEASLSAQVLGFVGQDANGLPRGYFGLEGYYERQLQGQAGQIRQEKDPSGKPILIGDYLRFDSKPGRDLVTTVNRSLQYLTEKKLKDGLVRYGAKQGVVIVLDSRTGAILSLASSPHYDPRYFYKFDPVFYKNPNAANLFEPGSIFKPLVMAAAIDAAAVTPDSACDICSGPIRIGEYTISTWNNQYYPNTSMTDVIVHSDNTGMVYAARRLGADKLASYLSAFGLDKKTGIDLEEEVAGNLRSASAWRDLDLATISFGQGIAVTPIQLITAVNAIANRGEMVKPHLVSEIKGSSVTSFTPEVIGKPISPEAAAAVTRMMIAAVEDGEAKWAKPADLLVAGKTGTAQIPEGGKYLEDKTIASFVGFAPADEPKFTMLVVLWEPTTSPWGSETAAPLWFSIARDIMLLY